MKYAWLPVVFIGIAGIYLGIQRLQMDHVQQFGEYPCFFCASIKPDYEVLVFSSALCDQCAGSVTRVQRFCRLTGIKYGGAFYDDAEITFERLNELGLTMNSNFLVVILKDGIIIDTSTDLDVEAYLTTLLKEELNL